MLHILVTTILPDNMVELIPIKKGNYLRENEFVLEHKCRYWYCTNLQFQVRLLEKPL